MLRGLYYSPGSREPLKFSENGAETLRWPGTDLGGHSDSCEEELKSLLKQFRWKMMKLELGGWHQVPEGKHNELGVRMLCSSSGLPFINCNIEQISPSLSPHFLNCKMWTITSTWRLSGYNKNNRCKVHKFINCKFNTIVRNVMPDKEEMAGPAVIPAGDPSLPISVIPVPWCFSPGCSVSSAHRGLHVSGALVEGIGSRMPVTSECDSRRHLSPPLLWLWAETQLAVLAAPQPPQQSGRATGEESRSTYQAQSPGWPPRRVP